MANYWEEEEKNRDKMDWRNAGFSVAEKKAMAKKAAAKKLAPKKMAAMAKRSSGNKINNYNKIPPSPTN